MYNVHTNCTIQHTNTRGLKNITQNSYRYYTLHKPPCIAEVVLLKNINFSTKPPLDGFFFFSFSFNPPPALSNPEIWTLWSDNTFRATCMGNHLGLKKYTLKFEWIWAIIQKSYRIFHDSYFSSLFTSENYTGIWTLSWVRIPVEQKKKKNVTVLMRNYYSRYWPVTDIFKYPLVFVIQNIMINNL